MDKSWIFFSVCSSSIKAGFMRSEYHVLKEGFNPVWVFYFHHVNRQKSSRVLCTCTIDLGKWPLLAQSLIDVKNVEKRKWQLRVEISFLNKKYWFQFSDSGSSSIEEIACFKCCLLLSKNQTKVNVDKRVYCGKKSSQFTHDWAHDCYNFLSRLLFLQ